MHIFATLTTASKRGGLQQGFSVRLCASTLYAVRCTQYAARLVQYVPTVRCCTLCVPFSSVAAAGMCAGSGLALSGSMFVKGCCNMWHASKQDPYMPPIQASTLVSTSNRPVVLMCHLRPTAVLQIAFDLPSAGPSL
jgi:hypothetical protein